MSCGRVVYPSAFGHSGLNQCRALDFQATTHTQDAAGPSNYSSLVESSPPPLTTAYIHVPGSGELTESN